MILNRCIQFVFSCIDLSMYSRSIWACCRWCSSANGDAPGDGDRLNLELVLAELGDGDKLNLEIHLEAVIE